MAKQNRKEQASNERAVFDSPVKAQRGDIYKVLSLGTCVEFTDSLTAANSAYKEASVPKTMFKIARGSGHVTKVYEQII